MVGGLTDVGFSADGRFLLVVGHQGRGLYDCLSGERVARDRNEDWSYFDDATGTVAGIGPLADQRVQVAGLMSQAILPVEADGWIASRDADGIRLQSRDGETHLVPESEEIQVFGFAPDGELLVVGASSGLTFYRRSR
jgi:hypothetical protein